MTTIFVINIYSTHNESQLFHLETKYFDFNLLEDGLKGIKRNVTLFIQTLYSLSDHLHLNKYYNRLLKVSLVDILVLVDSISRQEQSFFCSLTSVGNVSFYASTRSIYILYLLMSLDVFERLKSNKEPSRAVGILVVFSVGAQFYDTLSFKLCG